MRNPRRTAIAAAPLTLALLLAACSDDDPADDATTTTTAAEAEATSSSTASAPSETEATEPPSSETTAPPETEPPSQAGDPLPEAGDVAPELVRAWGAGDRERAAELATPAVVDQLFGHADPGGDDWELLSCDSTAIEQICTFTSVSRGESLTTHEGGDGIASVTFGTATDVVRPELAEAADALVRAWGAGDRAAAAAYADETDVRTLFGFADPGGDTWDRATCLTVEDDQQCTYRAPDRDETVIVHLGGAGTLPVSYVFVFRPS